MIRRDYKKNCSNAVILNCLDFKTEKKDLEVLCDEITTDLPFNVNIIFTPKFHCELTGEWIEYAWGAAKRMYRRQPIQKKRSVANFEDLVTQSLNYISVGMVRRFSGKARSYVIL